MKTGGVGTEYTVISVESRKGGVGKTTAALVIANLLTERGFSVLLIDADITGTNTARAAQDSHIWRSRTRAVTVAPTNEREGSGDDVLLELFDAFMSGRPIDKLIGNSFSPRNDPSRFPLIGSRLIEREKSALHSPAILFDELHSYWFRLFLAELSEIFARSQRTNEARKPITIIIDNSPGFTGIAPALHNWLTDLGPRRGKFLTITSPDAQDLTACGDSVADIHSLVEMKFKVAQWARVAKGQDVMREALDDAGRAFLIRLVEDTNFIGGADQEPGDIALREYISVATGSTEVQYSVSQYQGIVINKVNPILLDESVKWNPEGLFESGSVAHNLLFSDGGIRHRVVEYDQHLELQFSQFLLRKAGGPPGGNEGIVSRLEDLERRLPRGVSYPTKLRRRIAEPMAVDRAFRNCRRAFLVLQNYIERSVRILEENQLGYVSRLVRPEWYPRSFLESLRGTFINAAAESRELPFHRGISDIPLRLTPRNHRLLSRMFRRSHDEAAHFPRHSDKSFLNSMIIVVGLSIIDFLNEDDLSEGIIRTLSELTVLQANQYAEFYAKDGIDQYKERYPRGEGVRPAAFLALQANLRPDELAEALAPLSRRSRSFTYEIYPALCSAQARLLDLEADAKLLGWTITEAVKVASQFAGQEIFLPDLGALIDPVIAGKTVTHSEAREQASRLLRGASYLQRFSEPLREILAHWNLGQ